MISASLSISDLNGPVSLGVYIAGYFLTLIWTLKRRSNKKANLSHAKTAEVMLTDPYEIAYLAGGLPRCAEVAVIKLITSGAASYIKSRIIGETRLARNGPAQSNFHIIEQTLHSDISGYGSSGMSLLQISESLSTKLSGIESKLARLGLRPTASELNFMSLSITFPMFLWAGFGLIKLFVAITHDQHVFFLAILMILTFATAATIASLTNKLTPNGDKSLKKMRMSRDYEDDPIRSVALFGAASITSHYIAGLDPTLLREISQMGTKTKQSGSSGCSTGCSSGCGGGGCGGD
jgi:uncharacterized protein (TIGR04222 family)